MDADSENDSGADRLEPLRRQLETLLQDGLATQWQERAYTSEAVNELVARLQTLARDDHAGKLTLAGFTLQPYQASDSDISQSCETCIYYLATRKFCALPELRLPVEPEWSCVLWRV